MDKTMRPKVLIVDDEGPIREVLSASLADDHYEVQTASSGEEAIRGIPLFQPQVVLLDIWMPGSLDGIEVLQKVRGQYPQIEFIVMSGHGNIETAVRATKLGAWDFVEKPLSIEKISILLTNIINYQQEKREKAALLSKLRRNIAIIGESGPIKNLKQMIARAAPTPSWTLITGENGTGKELVAQNLHYLSPRASQAFVDVNCAAIPEDLMESELFGHERGAFTGAHKTKKGKFDFADGGTLFLDEVADLSLPLQEKILRVLKEQSFQRVGGEEPVTCDVRVIAATNRNLEAEVKAGKFNEDLYHRLNAIPFQIPPLRQRAEDVPSLVIHFSEIFSRDGGYRRKFFSEKAMGRLKDYFWPGNVRELRNFVERLYILTPGDFIDQPELKTAGLFQPHPTESAEEAKSFREARAQFEKDYLLKKITENSGNISKTAELIGLERSYLHRKIKTYGIDVEEII